MNRRSVNRLARQLMPLIALAVILVPLFIIQPRTMSYFGLRLLLNLAIPLALATVAQMLVIMVNDLDLSIGAFVSFTACVTVQLVPNSPLLGIGMLLLGIAAYGAVGALIHLRNLPSIVVTLGMSFVWLGVSVLILPRPGGAAPAWLQAAANYRSPLIPLPIILAVVIGAVMHVVLMRSGYGAILRGIGGNSRAVARAGWSILRAKVLTYMLAGVFGVLAGMLLAGTTTSADANIASRYTMLSIAGVILGGGDFFGGRISPSGAVLGAITMTLAGSFLSFVKVSTDWQIGAQGIILIIVLAGRLVTAREVRQS
ncbi:MAG: ABC transporter permease [Spirochaetales bacterium]|nr:ABC transporter permease [Spirochaetales bacterium]